MWTIGGVTYEWSPDWFQGWAAVVAFGLALHQGYSASRRERARDRAAATAALALVSNASQTIIHMHIDMMGVDGSDRARIAANILKGGRLAELQSALVAFDTTRLPKDVFVTGVIMAQTCVREFRQAIETIAEPPPGAVLIVRDPAPPANRIQQAAGMMVEPLVHMAPGAARRRITHWFRERLPQRASRSSPGQ